MSKPMKKFRFQCSACGEMHEGSPSFGYSAPHYYDLLSDEDKKKLAILSEDFCAIKHEEGKDCFIRTILEVPIHGADAGFLWGVWISVSETNFNKYRDNFRNDAYEDHYFGWFSNRLPYYPDTLALKTRACVQPGGQRPGIELEPTNHPLSIDYRNGISWDKAIEIAELILHRVN
jgi:hypothetical protein